MEEEKKEKQLSLKKQRRIDKKNEKWLAKYGVKYTDCLAKNDEEDDDGKTKEINYIKKLPISLKTYAKPLIFTLVLGAIIALMQIVTPVMYQNVIDTLTDGLTPASELVAKILPFLLISCGVTIIACILINWQNNVINTNYHKMAHSLRTKLISNISRTKVSKFDSTSTGEILNRVDGSSNEFSACVVNFISYIPVILESFIFIVYGLIVNVWLGLLFTFTGLVTFLIKVKGNKRYVLTYHRCSNILHDKKISQYNEIIRGARDIKALNAKERLLSIAEGISYHTYMASNDNANAYNNLRLVEKIVNAFLLSSTILLGVYLVSIQAVGIGGLLVLLMYRHKFGNFFETISDWAVTKQSLNITAERMYEIFDDNKYPKETFGDKTLENIKGNIDIKNMSFSYKDEEIFKNLNLSIKANECVGIVGKSGGGKSTLISLISKFYEVDSGEILVDNTNINELTENCLRGMITIVPQMPYIFNLSIRENLKISNENATDEELMNACKKAYLDDFINNLPNGLETLVGEGGIKLSGGQRQRLAIARAFLKPTKILILDEATSALDNESQEYIKKTISDIKNKCTIIIVAHRLTTVKDCDKIIVIDKHEIVGQGSHETLLETCPAYQKLYGASEEE